MEAEESPSISTESLAHGRETKPAQMLKRAPNLSKREQEALINGVRKRKASIFGDVNSPDYSSKTHKAWDEICSEVNAVNLTGVKREMKWIKERFVHWKSEVKKKLAKNEKERKITGGGEGNFLRLDGLDQRMAELIAPQEVQGLAGVREIGLENYDRESRVEQDVWEDIRELDRVQAELDIFQEEELSTREKTSQGFTKSTSTSRYAPLQIQAVQESATKVYHHFANIFAYSQLSNLYRPLFTPNTPYFSANPLIF